MKRAFAAAVILWAVGLAPVLAGPPDGLEPKIFATDFESGSVGAWSSYPPAQDTAYDPTIWVKRVDGNPGLALTREIQPWSANAYTFGVRRKLDLLATPDSVLSFRYYLKAYGDPLGAPRPDTRQLGGTGSLGAPRPDTRQLGGIATPVRLTVKFAFEDGGTAEVSVPVEKLLSWERAEVPLRDLVGATGLRRLTAVALMAVCPKADPETRLRFAVDDFRIAGLAEMKPILAEPGSHWLDEMGAAVGATHFVEGEALRLRGEFPADVAGADIALSQALTGDDSRVVKVRVAGRAWEAVLPGPAVKPGLWRAEIRARLRKPGPFGPRALSLPFVFLALPRRAPTGHPRLLATPAGRAEILAAVETGGLRPVWDKLVADARELRTKHDARDFNYNLDAYDEVFWLPTYEGYVRALHTPSRSIRENAVVHFLSGDKDAGEAARRGLLALARWPSWVHPHILNQGQFTYWPVGIALIDLALGYDFAYDTLTPEERRTVAEALYDKGVTEVFKEYVRDNRVSSDTSNWISHVTTGAALCALAAADEIPAERLEPYLTGAILKLGRLIENAFDPDGVYGEGYYYHNFTMQSLPQAMAAFERLGVAFPKKIADSYRYILYQLDPASGRLFEYGDAHDDLIPSSMSNWAYILRRDRSPVLRSLYAARPGQNYLDLLFPCDRTPAPLPPGLPLTARFRETGMTVFRSGFGAEDFVFVFKAGPFYNHQHFDQGSFFLADRGRTFFDESGNSNYYEDPWYQRLFIQAGGHNTLLADGDVESQQAGDLLKDVPAWGAFARTTDFLETPDAAVLSADLTPLYKGRFGSLRRNILYLKPRTVVIIDRALEAPGVDRLNARFHVPRKEDVRAEGGTAIVERSGRTLSLRTLYPADIESTIVKRPLSINEFKAENAITMKARGFLELATPLRDGRAAFVNIMGTDEKAIEGARTAAVPGGLELETAAGTWIVNTDGGLVKTKNTETDAILFKPGTEGFLALRATMAKLGGRVLFEATKPVSLSLEIGQGRAVLSYSAAEPSDVVLSLEKRPGSVKPVEGSPVRWSFSDGRLRARLSGEGKLEIK